MHTLKCLAIIGRDTFYKVSDYMTDIDDFDTSSFINISELVEKDKQPSKLEQRLNSLREILLSALRFAKLL